MVLSMLKSEPGSGRTVRRLGIEFLLIVAGVLVALWVESLREAHGNRQREQIALHQLLVATRENVSRIGAAIAVDSSSLAAADRLMTVLRAPGALPPADSLFAWRTAAFRFSVFLPLTGPYSALAETGDLNLFRDDSLRAAVAVYTGELEGMVAQIAEWTATFHRNTERLVAGVPLEGVRAAYLNRPGGQAEWRLPAIERALFLQSIIARNRFQDLQQLLAQTTALQRQLEATLGSNAL